MSAYFEVVLSCDFDGRNRQARARTPSTERARVAAGNRGWVRRQGSVDLCPEHAAAMAKAVV